MSRKIFITVSIIMTILFVFSAIVRYYGAKEFEALEFRKENASRDRYVKLTAICTTSGRMAYYFCSLYPVSILLVWITDRKYFKTAIKTAIIAIAISALAWAVLPSLTNGRVSIFLLAFYCPISFVKTSLICVCVALSKKLYQYIKTISRP